MSSIICDQSRIIAMLCPFCETNLVELERYAGLDHQTYIPRKTWIFSKGVSILQNIFETKKSGTPMMDLYLEYSIQQHFTWCRIPFLSRLQPLSATCIELYLYVHKSNHLILLLLFNGNSFNLAPLTQTIYMISLTLLHAFHFDTFEPQQLDLI